MTHRESILRTIIELSWKRGEYLAKGTAQTEYTSGFRKKNGASDANNPSDSSSLVLIQLDLD